MTPQRAERRRRVVAVRPTLLRLKCAWLTAVCLATWPCWAAASEATLSSNVRGADLGDPQRLSAYEDNYAIWNQMRNDGWATKDERALRAKISFKYTFCGPQLRPPSAQARVDNTITEGQRAGSWCPVSRRWADAELFFGYTAEFDFYAGTRPSGPVIGRLNAPGLFIRLPADQFLGGSWKKTDRLEFGLQHRSNGQATPVSSDRDARIANEQYAAGNRPYFDTISRSANFVLLAVDKEMPTPPIGERLTLRAKLRLYLGGQESDITWGPFAHRGQRFSDYDRLQLMASWRLNKGTHVDLDWRLGDRGLATDSWTFGLEFKVLEFPVYLRVHRGPMNTLSTYSQRQDSVGVGFRFASL